MLTAALRGHCCCSNGRAAKFTAAKRVRERGVRLSVAAHVATPRLELSRPRQTLGFFENPRRLGLHREAPGRSRTHDFRIGGFEPGFREPKRIEPHEPQNGGGAEAE